MKNICILLFWFPILMTAQDTLEGVVLEANTENKRIGLSGANVYWLDSPLGTITLEEGTFTVPYDPKYNKLVISYIGFKTDTLIIDTPRKV